MVIYNSFNNEKLIQLIKDGGIGVIPTDTIYGLVCSAFDQDAVEKIYEIKGRDVDKPVIILISNLSDLNKFGVQVSEGQREFLGKYWPGKVSVILPLEENEFDYLSRGLGTLTFRLPNDGKLKALLQKVGPVVAPSANLQGEEPAKNIDEAMNYFLGSVDFGVDGGVAHGSASTLVDLTGNKPKVLRQGDVEIRDI